MGLVFSLTPGQIAVLSFRDIKYFGFVSAVIFLRFSVAYTGYEVHVVHVQPVHQNMMNHDDEDYREAGVQASDTKQHEGKATDMVSCLLSNVLQLA